jgi:hypothetical protein
MDCATAKLRMTIARSLAILVFLLLPATARAYFVSRPLSLGDMSAKADIIFKGTAVASVPGNGRWLSSMPGVDDAQMRFTIVSVIKGVNSGSSLEFRYYDRNQTPTVYLPQMYHFEIGRTYLVFAKRTDTPGVFKQLWSNATLKHDQGVFLCASSQPVEATTIKGDVWSELTGMLRSGDRSDVLYGIDQLDRASGGSWDGVSDFARTDVLAAVHGFMTNPDSEIARRAITVVGSYNPYMSADQAQYWLATVGDGDIKGLAQMDPQMENVGAHSYARELVNVANGSADDETRALAIVALGLDRDPHLEMPLVRWLGDPSPAVRSSAIVLLADFPDMATHERLAALAADPDPRVRAAAARSIGFAQQTAQADILSGLLADPDVKVRGDAATSLLSFSPRNDAIASIFKTHLEAREFAPLFLNALARDNPVPYLDGLAAAITEQTMPTNWSGGETPAYRSWELLFKYLQAQPIDTITSGKLDRYLDAIEHSGGYSSSEPRDVYALYVQRGMTARATNFRQKADKAAGYDLDYYFKQVDRDPSLYKRE